jgi:predicted outer membrane repeat protein
LRTIAAGGGGLFVQSDEFGHDDFVYTCDNSGLSSEEVGFHGNTATVTGGAIYINELDDVNMLVEGCGFGSVWAGTTPLRPNVTMYMSKILIIGAAQMPVICPVM